MAEFDPTPHGFVRLPDVKIPGVDVFEYANHPVVDGGTDCLRLNLYLSRDGDYVTAWFGFPEPLMVGQALSNLGIDVPDGADLQDTYTEELFRGRLNDANAAHVFDAIELDSAKFRPQRLHGDEAGRLACSNVDDPPPGRR